MLRAAFPAAGTVCEIRGDDSQANETRVAKPGRAEHHILCRQSLRLTQPQPT